MFRLTKIGILGCFFIPLGVSAGASLEDIEGTSTEVVRQVPASVRRAAVADSTPALGAVSSLNDDAQADSDLLGNSASAPAVFQFYSSDKAAELQYERNKTVFGLDNNRAVVSFLLNEERDNAMTASLMFDAAPKLMRGLKLSFGPKIIAGLLSIENSDVIGFAANLEAVYEAPTKRFPIRLSTGFSYAPDVLTFGQSDRIIDWNVRAGLPLTSNIEGFVGARYLQFDTRPGERKLDQRVHVGIRWSGKRS